MLVKTNVCGGRWDSPEYIIDLDDCRTEWAKLDHVVIAAGHYQWRRP